MRRLFAVLGVALTATLSGCAAGATAVTATATPAAKVSVSPVPAKVITVAVPKPATGAPGLATTGTAWLPILTSLSAYGQWLLANPDPALVGTIATPGCGVANLLTDQLTGLLGSKTYVKTSPASIVSVVAPSPAANGTVTLMVVASRPAEPVLSRAGAKTVSTFDAYPQGTLEVTLDLGADKRWRFCTIEANGDPAGATDASVPLI
jgi:hypothetical protein